MSRLHKSDVFFPAAALDSSLQNYVAKYQPQLLKDYEKASNDYANQPVVEQPAFALRAFLSLLEGIMDAPRERLIKNQHFFAAPLAHHRNTLNKLEVELAETTSPITLHILLNEIDATKSQLLQTERELSRLVDHHPEAGLSPHSSDPAPYLDENDNALLNQAGALDRLSGELLSQSQAMTRQGEQTGNVRLLHSQRILNQRQQSSATDSQLLASHQTLLKMRDEVIPHQIKFIEACLEDWGNADALTGTTLSDAIAVAGQLKPLYGKALEMVGQMATQVEKELHQSSGRSSQC